MSDAQLPKVSTKGPNLIDSKSYVSMALVVLLCGGLYAYGMKVGESKRAESDSEEKFKTLTAQVSALIVQGEANASATSLTSMKIDNLIATMEIRRASRDKQFDDLTHRVDDHEIRLRDINERIPKGRP